MLSDKNSTWATWNLKSSSSLILRSKNRWDQQFKPLKSQCVLYTESTSQFGPATVQELNGHMGLVVPVLDRSGLNTKGMNDNQRARSMFKIIITTVSSHIHSWLWLKSSELLGVSDADTRSKKAWVLLAGVMTMKTLRFLDLFKLLYVIFFLDWTNLGSFQETTKYKMVWDI